MHAQPPRVYVIDRVSSFLNVTIGRCLLFCLNSASKAPDARPDQREVVAFLLLPGPVPTKFRVTQLSAFLAYLFFFTIGLRHLSFTLESPVGPASPFV